MKKFGLKPTIEVECPFCGNKYKRKIKDVSNFGINCSCGSLIEFGCELVVCRAISKEEK